MKKQTKKTIEYVVDKKIDPTFCCICKKVKGVSKIIDGNPSYKNKPICKECNTERKLLQETK